MSITNHIKSLLDIQDDHIYFDEKDEVKLKEFKGKISKFITGKLTYTPSHCECGGIKNEDFTVYKNGTKTSRITLPISGIYPTYLNLKKQRFFCKSCGSSFIAKTSIVDEHCFISNHTKSKVLIKSADALSAALDTQNTKLISSYMKTSLKTLRKHLPYIENSFNYVYNNGRIEGINNKIKVLNRVAYSYRNFTNFKNRILLHFKLKQAVSKGVEDKNSTTPIAS